MKTESPLSNLMLNALPPWQSAVGVMQSGLAPQWFWQSDGMQRILAQLPAATRFSWLGPVPATPTTALSQLCQPWPVTLAWTLTGSWHLTPVADQPQQAPSPHPKQYWVEWQTRTDTEELAQQVAQAVNGSFLLDEMMDALAQVLHTAVPYSGARLAVLDETQNRVKLLAHLSPQGLEMLEGQCPGFVGDDPVLAHSLTRWEAQLYGAGHNKPRSMVWEEDLENEGLEKAVAMALPLVNKGVCIGVLALWRLPKEGALPFEPEEQSRLVQLGAQLAAAVENAQFYLRTQAQASREFLMNQLTSAIRQSLEVETILATAVKELGQVLGASRCLLEYWSTPLAADTLQQWFNNPNAASFVQPQVYRYHQPGTLPLATEGTASTALQAMAFRASRLKPGQSLLLDPFVLDTLEAEAPPGLSFEVLRQQQVASWVVVPLLLPEGLVGTLSLQQCGTPRTWLPEDITLLSSLAEQLGVALAQARLFGELARQKRSLEAALLELQEAQTHLVQNEKMAVIGQFVAGIAHEVNTPLGSMMSNTDTLASCVKKMQAQSQSLAAESLPEAFSDKRLGVMSQLLSINQMASERIRDIVKNLRNFARLDESERKEADLHEGLDSTLLLLQSAFPKNLSLQKQYDAELPPLLCYPGLLNQVFMNLLVNALHATEDKPEPVITLKTQYQTATPTQAAQIVVSVSDNGKGIAPDHLQKIFDPGFTTKGRGVGTGLGLALCFRMVDKHAGRIEVESTLGQGTCFKVILPLV